MKCEKELLSGEVALACRVHPLTVNRWAASGKLRYRLNTHGWKLFRSEDVEKIKRERAAEQLISA